MYEVKFFFYGILVDYDPMDPHIKVVDRIDGTTLGRLYDLGPFPGAKFGGYDEVVTGKVVIFQAPTIGRIQNLIAGFDNIESYNPTNEEDSFYIRKNVSVITTDGFHKCQAYEFNTPHETLKEKALYVPGGDWHKFKEIMESGTSEEVQEVLKTQTAIEAQVNDEEEIL